MKKSKEVEAYVEEQAQTLNMISSRVKMITGVINNATVAVIIDAFEQVKKHPRYRQRVKKLFNDAINEMHDYERDLLCGKSARFFHVDDMTDQTRAFYGRDMTDAEFFEFWKGMGAMAYSQTRPLVTSLWNKFRLSLMQHNIQHADIIAWAMTALGCLRLSCKVYERTIEDVLKVCNIRSHVAWTVFDCFKMHRIMKRWETALDALESTRYALDEIEHRNIEMGMLQIAEKWANSEFIYDCCLKAIKDYDEIFKSKGEQKRALRLIHEVKEETIEEIKNERKRKAAQVAQSAPR